MRLVRKSCMAQVHIQSRGWRPTHASGAPLMRWSLALALAGAGCRGVARCPARGGLGWTAWHPTASTAVPSSAHCIHASCVTSGSWSSGKRPPSNTKAGGGKKDSNDSIKHGIHNFVAINKRIIQSIDADTLLSIIANEHKSMNTVNVATAWHRLAKLAKKSRVGNTHRNKKTHPTHDVRCQILERLALEFVDEFDCMNLTNIVWSLAVLEHNFGGGAHVLFLNRACERIVQSAKSASKQKVYPENDKHVPSAQALSNLLWAFTTMRHTQHAHQIANLIVEITPKLIGSFTVDRKVDRKASPLNDASQTQKVGGAFVTQTISNQLWAFGKLNKHPGDLHMDLLALITSAHITHFKPQELTNIVWAFSVLSHYPGDEALITFEHEIAMRTERNNFNSQNLSTLILALSSFSHDDGAGRASLSKVMKALDCDSILNLIPKFNGQDLANAVFGAAQLGGFASAFYEKCWRQMVVYKWPPVDPEVTNGALMIYNASLLMDAMAPRVSNTLPPMPSWMSEYAKQLWEQQAESGTVSEFQRDVSKRLKAINVEHDTETTTADKQMSMDIYLRQYSTALECDGPSHFCVNGNVGRIPLSRNLARDALLNHRGVHAVSVPWDRWATSEDDGTCDAWLASIVNTVRTK